MEPVYDIITQEIPVKGIAYLILRKCHSAQVDEAVREGAQKLLRAGAERIYLTSTDPATPLSEGEGVGFRLEHRHDILCLEKPLTAQRLDGTVTLEPLTPEKAGQWLTLFNAAFFNVPNGATYTMSDLPRLLEPDHLCGFAVVDGVEAGIYECVLGAVPEVEAIGLSEDLRFRGLGRALLRAVLELLRSRGCTQAQLSVSTANTAAYRLYRSEGFRQYALRSRWYEVLAQGDLAAEQ